MKTFIVIVVFWISAANAATHPTAAECKQIREAVKTYGITMVLVGARFRGYTDKQVNYARRKCHV